ncbi:MAG: chromosome segregation protein SMC, partial [Candidatus Acidiferrales bacterium]
QLAQLRPRQAALEERLTAVRAEQARLQEATQRLATAQQDQQETEARLRTRQAELVQEIEHLEQAVEQRRLEKQAQEARCQERDAERDLLRQRLQERETTVRTQRTQLEAAREQRHALEVNQARQQAEREHAETAVQSEFGLTGEDLCLQTNYRLIGAALAEAETRDREIKHKLENIGPINMMALEEFQECEQRHGFLTKQRDDLLASIEDTRLAISEIDEVSRQRFNQAFAIINQNFAETFRTLFDGGSATLRLTDEESPGDSGVDLICQPPGKRLQNVLLLSGGEKALTALALLIAIFRYSPSPFCILDEVDAPLDDTNIGRFTRLLVEMSAQTQFILITHSKKTMEVASLLYGVTMQRAVSQIVSVRFDQAA